jgi:two-component system chemotaxis response regulator CheB
MAQAAGDDAIALLLTGMGDDGAQALLALRTAGATTLAQDEATSVVFGMPRQAIELGAAGEVLGLPEIAPRLRALARPTGRNSRFNEI